MRLLVGFLGALLGVGALFGYVYNGPRTGVIFFQEDPTNVVYYVDQATRAGLTNNAGEVTISAESAPEAAIWAAMERWNALPHTAVRFAPPVMDAANESTFDNRNLITFSDTTSARSILGGAVAVTRFFSSPDGALTDADIIFNPALPFSTTLDRDAFDIEGVLAHELGHALGADHSPVATSTMFASVARGQRRLRSLSDDDGAYAVDVYPSSTALTSLGEIRGRISGGDGDGVPGVIVAAVETSRHVALSALTEADGGYRIAGVPPGEYMIYVEPLDGPTTTGHLSATRSGADTSFRTRFAEQAVTVGAGGAAFVDLAVDESAPTLNARGLAAFLPGEDPVSRLSASLERGRVYEAEVFGERLDEVAESDITFLGEGVRVEPGSLFVIGSVTFGGDGPFPLIGFNVEVDANAPLGAVSLLFELDGERSVITGGAEVIEATSQPRFSADAVTNAASFRATSVAPGEIVSIFGEAIGPATPAAGDFDPLTGRLTPALDEVMVLFNGLPGAIFYAESGQINVQAPAELGASGVAFVEIVNGERRSDAVGVPMAPTAPGIFTGAGGRALIVNPDGRLNAVDAPATIGDTIVLYATGQGALDPPLGTGEAAGFTLSRATASTRLTVGGVEAAVTFAGMAPGLVGLFQVNAVIVEGTPAGDALDVQLRVGGAVSPLGPTMTVR